MNPKPHQTTLRILLVLSLVNAVVSAVAYLGMALLLPTMGRMVEANSALFPAEFAVMWERMAAVPRPLYAAQSALYILSFVGCILMWNLRRSGFHAYAIAQLLLLLLPLLFLGKAYLGLGDLMFTALFLTVYYLLLRQLGVFERENTGDQPPAE